MYRRWSDSVARDLASSLRNWLQLAKPADAYAQSQQWTLSFPAFENVKSANRLSRQYGGERLHFPSGSARRGMQVVELRTFNAALTGDQVRRLADETDASKKGQPRPSRRYHKLSEWLDVEVSELTVGSKRRGILRKEYIDRVANTLGGSHPINAPEKDSEYRDIDRFIAERAINIVNNMPEPYTHLMDVADGILLTYRRYLD